MNVDKGGEDIHCIFFFCSTCNFFIGLKFFRNKKSGKYIFKIENVAWERKAKTCFHSSDLSGKSRGYWNGQLQNIWPPALNLPFPINSLICPSPAPTPPASCILHPLPPPHRISHSEEALAPSWSFLPLASLHCNLLLPDNHFLKTAFLRSFFVLFNSLKWFLKLASQAGVLHLH